MTDYARFFQVSATETALDFLKSSKKKAAINVVTVYGSLALMFRTQPGQVIS